MPVLDWDPGTNPKAAGTLSFYKEGEDPSTGFQVTTEGVVSAGGATHLTGDAGTDDMFTVRVAGDAEPQLVINANGRVELGGGVTAPDVAWFRDGSARLHTVNDFVTEGNLIADVAGKGLTVREGANARMGTATLTAGTVVVSTTAVTANSRVFLTAQNTGGTPGALRVSARTAGTSFTITSTSGTDTSSVAWMIVEPVA